MSDADKGLGEVLRARVSAAPGKTALRFLRQGGDPYDFSIKDPTGEVGINFGVYGVPETFVIDKKGVIRYKQIGPITPEAWDKKIHPLINQLKAE